MNPFTLRPEKGFWQVLLPWLILAVIWQGAAAFFPPAILPSLTETLAALLRLASTPVFYHHLAITAWRGAAGFGMAMGLGLAAGLAMGWRPAVDRLLRPLMVLATNVPPIAWIALLLIWLGLGDGPPLVVIVTTVTPLVAVNVAQGVRELDLGLLEMADIFQVSRANRLRHIILPALRGRVFAAALLALGFTWRVLVMAEFLGSTAGLGYRLSWARQNLDTDIALAYILVIVALSLVIELGLRRLFAGRLPEAITEQPDDIPHRHADGQWHSHPPLHDHPEEAG